MAKKRRRRGGHKRGKVVIKQQAKLVHKGDSVGRDSIGGDSLPKAPTRLAPDAGVNFKVRLKKK